jgi:8-oxo-dGTP pyrophosphatase MutT (NUDIX family)
VVKREFSAGGVVVRAVDGRVEVAAIRPAGKPSVWALPKGNIGEGERAEEAAAREVEEETGIRATPVAKLGHVRYTYSHRGERIFKIVTFFLFRYVSGKLGDLKREHAHEVAEVRWLPLTDATKLLTYGGEREMARAALAIMEERGEPL